MLTMFLRAGILYIFIIIIMRSMGKRQVGQLRPYELVISILIADLASAPMNSSSIPLLHGIMPIMALVLLQSIFTIISIKNDKLSQVINGHPCILIKNGVVDEVELRKQAISLSELMEEARVAGYSSLAEIGCAVLEVSGNLSVFPISQKRYVTPSDMNISTQYEGLTLALILDGDIQSRNLQKGNVSREWLLKKLEELHMHPKQVFVCLLNTKGVMTIQLKGKNTIHINNALQENEVTW